MDFTKDPILRSMRRARGRFRILVYLAARGQASVADIAHATGMRWTRVLAALEGREHEYDPQLSLIGLGLARRVATLRWRVYAVTARGRTVARRLHELLAADPVVREYVNLAKAPIPPDGARLAPARDGPETPLAQAQGGAGVGGGGEAPPPR